MSTSIALLFYDATALTRRPTAYERSVEFRRMTSSRVTAVISYRQLPVTATPSLPGRPPHNTTAPTSAEPHPGTTTHALSQSHPTDGHCIDIPSQNQPRLQPAPHPRHKGTHSSLRGAQTGQERRPRAGPPSGHSSQSKGRQGLLIPAVALSKDGSAHVLRPAVALKDPCPAHRIRRRDELSASIDA